MAYRDSDVKTRESKSPQGHQRLSHGSGLASLIHMAQALESKPAKPTTRKEVPVSEPVAPDPRQVRLDDRDRQSIELDRKRIGNQMRNATTPARKSYLEGAMKFLDEKLSNV